MPIGTAGLLYLLFAGKMSQFVFCPLIRLRCCQSTTEVTQSACREAKDLRLGSIIGLSSCFPDVVCSSEGFKGFRGDTTSANQRICVHRSGLQDHVQTESFEKEVQEQCLKDLANRKMYGFRPISRDSEEIPKRDERFRRKIQGQSRPNPKNEVAIIVTASSSASRDMSDVKNSIACSKNGAEEKIHVLVQENLCIKECQPQAGDTL